MAQIDRKFFMNNRLFVGNLDFSTMDHQLKAAFEEHGEVVSATVVTDRMTGQSRGFGFVEFTSTADAERAVEAMNGSMLNGRSINVNVARERTQGGRGPGGGGGGRGGFGGGGGGGGRGGRDGGGRGGRGGRDGGGRDRNRW